jgi:cation:H+ antiporter
VGGRRRAGTEPSETAANLAVAIMAGANRILVGLGWSLIALYAIYRAKPSADAAVAQRDGLLADAARLESRISIELLFLGAATVYVLFIPFGGGIDALDTLVLVGLYGAYVFVMLRGESTHEPQLGVAGSLQRLPRSRRIPAILLMFTFSAVVILVAGKPFAKGLGTLGLQLGLSSFFMIQRVAPLASESPEFIATAYLVNKARTTSPFNALISEAEPVDAPHRHARGRLQPLTRGVRRTRLQPEAGRRDLADGGPELPRRRAVARLRD